jgi:Xaa-Pro aminopeptidase
MGNFKLENDAIGKNIEKMREYLVSNKIDAAYITSFDPFLNEYVPMSNSHRYYLTGFTGSVAEVILPKNGKVRLYVDGRYHEQADNEVDLNMVEVVKVPQNKGLWTNAKEDLELLKIDSLVVESKRIPLSYYEYLEKNYKTSVDAFESMLSTVPLKGLKPIIGEDLKWVGKSTSEKLKIINPDKKAAYFVTALDSLAWISNCRGYHLPFQSAFLGKALATHDKLYIFIDSEIEVEASAQDQSIEWIHCSDEELESHLKSIQDKIQLSKVYYNPSSLNANDMIALKKTFSESGLELNHHGLVPFHSIKDDVEMKTIRENFKKGDRAIYQTIKWVKESTVKGEKISERDLYNKTSEFYQKEGAIEQSFNTISGRDAHGSIIHYGDPKSDAFIEKDSMVLLDSGGYFHAGFATDTTRTFMGGGSKPSARHKEIYTLTLKGTLNLQNAVFPDGTKGNVLDGYARSAMWRKGFDYAHGTGHGVGINVHESGVRISPLSNVPMRKGQVVSIEPGIYIPGFAGVRLENIAHVVEAKNQPGFLTFEPLVYIGFEHELIDESLLTNEEKAWLDEYEALCEKRGTSFKN